MADSRVTVHIQLPGNLGFMDIVGTAPTIAAARTEAQAKTALVTGTVLSVSESTVLADHSAYVTAGASDTGRDANLIVRKTGDVTAPRQSKKIRMMSSDFADPDDPGVIDKTNTTVIAYGAALTDSDGNTGFDVLSGKYVN